MLRLLLYVLGRLRLRLLCHLRWWLRLRMRLLWDLLLLRKELLL